MPLILLELSHALLGEPLRFVNDNRDIVSNGRRYIACAFQFVWPDDQDQQAPAAQLSISNIGGGLGAFFERTHGGKGTRITARQIMRSNPDFVEDELRLDLRNIEVTMQAVTGQLGYTRILDIPGTAYTYRPETAPGIF
ncbi:TPA: DUF1833 family protein [Burkholderia stabilis]|nr:DUF1833 family protein [Burkholderia stabilis]HDR9589114.1 DUF1833 family protein [Burkholderia stabilis]HDR9649510.1 DUF1833 family protein [Burkholderia stabilis]HDR9653576.1 DUF1833 family protein [Burkholderia stabilis]HDR9656271.1 DUF1833 family protein [Burkholderia stabilis]